MTIDASWYRRPDGIVDSTAAGGVIVRIASGRVVVALIRESDSPGYVLPKGHVEAGEDLERAARREIEEETGFTRLKILGSLGTRERLDHRKSAWKTTHYYLFLTDEVDGSPTESDRYDSPEWFSIDDLPAMFWPEQRNLIESNRRQIAWSVGAASLVGKTEGHASVIRQGLRARGSGKADGIDSSDG